MFCCPLFHAVLYTLNVLFLYFYSSNSYLLCCLPRSSFDNSSSISLSTPSSNLSHFLYLPFLSLVHLIFYLIPSTALLYSTSFSSLFCVCLILLSTYSSKLPLFLHLILHQDCSTTCSKASPRGRQSSTDTSITRDAY